MNCVLYYDFVIQFEAMDDLANIDRTPRHFSLFIFFLTTVFLSKINIVCVLWKFYGIISYCIIAWISHYSLEPEVNLLLCIFLGKKSVKINELKSIFWSKIFFRVFVEVYVQTLEKICAVKSMIILFFQDFYYSQINSWIARWFIVIQPLSRKIPGKTRGKFAVTYVPF